MKKYGIGTLPQRNAEVVEKCGGSYKYLGLANGITRVLNAVTYEIGQINLIDNTDGIPVFKSLNKQVWPILCIFGGFHPFLLTVFFSEKKPNDVNSFPTDSFQEYELLKKNQFDFQHKHYTVNILAFVCDGPAREFLKSIKSHNAYYTCERCIVQGRWEGRVLFDDINCNLRTNQSFIKPYHDHQIGKTPLIDPGVDCTMQFPLDYIHLVCLGVMKRLLSFWKEVPRPFRLAPFQISQISGRFKRHDRINAL